MNRYGGAKILANSFIVKKRELDTEYVASNLSFFNTSANAPLDQRGMQIQAISHRMPK